MKVAGKAINWDKGHTDYYMYSKQRGAWYKVWCTLSGNMACTALQTYRRGTIGGYYFSESGERAEAMLMMLESQIQKKIG